MRDAAGAYRVFTASLLLCWSVSAPRFAAQDRPHRVYSARSEVVVVHATVVDRRGRLVAGLGREDFAIFDNGQAEAVTFFNNDDSPVTVGLVIDCSGSMERKREAVVSAGLAFGKSSNPADEMFTVNFNERVWPGLPPSLPFTTDAGQLRAALDSTTARGQTALFDGIAHALAHLDQGHEPKKVLIVVSDGRDNASRFRFEQVLDAALRKDAMIYALGLYDEYHDADPEVLKKLARATGGEAYFPRTPHESTNVLERIAREIRSGYTLGYVPSSLTGGYRTIRVEARSRDGRKLKVRARSGYLAGGPGEGHGRD